MVTIDIAKNLISYGSTYQSQSFEPLVVVIQAIQVPSLLFTLLSRGWNSFFGVYSDLDVSVSVEESAGGGFVTTFPT